MTCDAHRCHAAALYAVWFTPTGTPCHYCRAHFKDVSINLLSRAKFTGDDLPRPADQLRQERGDGEAEGRQ